MYGKVKNIFRSYVPIPGILQTGSKCSLLTMENNCIVHLSNEDAIGGPLDPGKLADGCTDRSVICLV